MPACSPSADKSVSINLQGRSADRARARTLAVIPIDFPHPVRLGNSKLFRTLYGGTARSTWAEWLATNKIPAPDKKVGQSSFWKETTMAATIAVQDEQAVAQ